MKAALEDSAGECHGRPDWQVPQKPRLRLPRKSELGAHGIRRQMFCSVSRDRYVLEHRDDAIGPAASELLSREKEADGLTTGIVVLLRV